MRNWIAALGIGLAASAVAQIQPPRPPAARPKLVLAIVVDQFRYDYLLRFRSGYTSGLARLLREGAVFTNAFHEHFPTVTAVGHATFLSGALPTVSGIVGNEWYDRATGRQVTSVSDSSVELLGSAGGAGASPRRLLVSTLVDELKMSGRGESKAIGVSMKDRSAILPVGHMADAAYWFDSRSGNFVSSTYYFPELPSWVRQFNDSRHVDRFAGAVWTAIEAPGGKPFRTMAATAGVDLYGSLQRSPYGNELVAGFAERAIEAEQLGRHAGVDLLAVSFSANDYIGHALGPDAPEVRDISIRTDRLLGRLFQFAESRVGAGNLLVALTADHGVAPMPEVMQKRKMPGGRLPEEAVIDQVKARLSQLYGEGNWVAGKSGPAPYLNEDLIRQRKLDPAAVRRMAAEAAREVPHVARVYTRDQLLSGQLPDDPIDRRMRNGAHPTRLSDLFIVPEPYWVFEDEGTSHGTPYNYDAHVPVILMGPGVRAGRYHRRVAVNDIAPTLATLLGVETPAGSTGRVLEEALAR